MNSERQREIARKGGRAAHVKGTAHQFTSDEARAAGRKGGERVSQDRSHMATIGRMGGRSSAGRRAKNAGDGSDPGKNPMARNQSNPGNEMDRGETDQP
jgi:general stress protein YciG